MTDRNTVAPIAREDAKRTDERELLLRHRNGDSSAFAGLVAGYRRPVYSYLVRCSVAESDREDLFQEIFVKIHSAAGSYEENRPLHPWVFTVVANTVRNYHRKNKVRALVFAEPDEQDPPSPAADAERQAMARQTTAWLEEEIRKLPLAQQEVLILTCVENLPQKEVAAILDLPINTVKTHLRRARLALIERRTAEHGEEPS